ncbi:MAG TPA: lysophospholipid acyltransferase family protein [Acidobacteriota bacterium]|nr:lysophospholipid acyltransferase family protein [Acidobacteriota bacterium]
MKRVVDWLVYVLVRGFFLLLSTMPMWLAYRFCWALADLIYLIDGKHRRIGLINLSLAFPDKDVAWKKKVLRLSFREQGNQAVLLSRLERLSTAEITRRITYEAGRGIENYLRARELGKGVIFVTAHIFAWEILPAAHAAYGYPLSFVVRPLDNPYLDRWLERLRSQRGNQAIAKTAAVRTALRILHQGRDIGFLIDQNIQEKEGVFVPFLGQQACTTSSVAAIALKTGAPVVPGFIYRSVNGRYHIRFYPPIEVRPGGNNGSDIVRYTAEFSRYVEEMIREFPHCWLWGHRRFATQPDGSNPYARTRSRSL